MADSDFIATFVPGYSGGPVPDLHRVPFSLTLVRPENITNLYRTLSVVSTRETDKVRVGQTVPVRTVLVIPQEIETE